MYLLCTANPTDNIKPEEIPVLPITNLTLKDLVEQEVGLEQPDGSSGNIQEPILPPLPTLVGDTPNTCKLVRNWILDSISTSISIHSSSS